MKIYTAKTLSKLTELLNKYPEADLRFGIHCRMLEYSKVLDSDIKYDKSLNIIYIG